jgi:hypothetical protein
MPGRTEVLVARSGAIPVLAGYRVAVATDRRVVGVRAARLACRGPPVGRARGPRRSGQAVVLNDRLIPCGPDRPPSCARLPRLAA